MNGSQRSDEHVEILANLILRTITVATFRFYGIAVLIALGSLSWDRFGCWDTKRHDFPPTAIAFCLMEFGHVTVGDWNYI